MAESIHHKNLVKRLVESLSVTLGSLECQSELTWFIDNAKDFQLPQPIKIGGHRPDVYVVGETITVLGEAKPARDLESMRTARQLEVFLRHVALHPTRHLVLSVHWTTAATARSVLRNVTSDWKTVCERVHVLDGVRPLMIETDKG